MSTTTATATIESDTIDQAQVEQEITRIINGRTLAQMQAAFNARFYDHDVCAVCGGPAPAYSKHLWSRSTTFRMCGPACIQLKEILYHGCCEQARILNDASAVAYHLSITCPTHGERRFGTSD